MGRLTNAADHKPGHCVHFFGPTSTRRMRKGSPMHLAQTTISCSATRGLRFTTMLGPGVRDRFFAIWSTCSERVIFGATNSPACCTTYTTLQTRTLDWALVPLAMMSYEFLFSKRDQSPLEVGPCRSLNSQIRGFAHQIGTNHPCHPTPTILAREYLKGRNLATSSHPRRSLKARQAAAIAPVPRG